MVSGKECRDNKTSFTDDGDTIDQLPTPQDLSNTNQTALPTPLDGGWGWAVVFGSFLVHIIADGVAYSFGILCEVFIHYFGIGKYSCLIAIG